MADLAFSRSDLLALLRLDSGEARQHARCGPSAACRRNAIAKCDEDLDLLLEAGPLEVPDLSAAQPGSDHG